MLNESILSSRSKGSTSTKSNISHCYPILIISWARRTMAGIVESVGKIVIRRRRILLRCENEMKMEKDVVDFLMSHSRANEPEMFGVAIAMLMSNVREWEMSVNFTFLFISCRLIKLLNFFQFQILVFIMLNLNVKSSIARKSWINSSSKWQMVLIGLSWKTSAITVVWMSTSASLIVGGVVTLIASSLLLLIALTLTWSSTRCSSLCFPLSISTGRLTTSALTLIRWSWRVVAAVITIEVVTRRGVIWVLLSRLLVGVVVWWWSRLIVALGSVLWILIRRSSSTAVVAVEIRLIIALLITTASWIIVLLIPRIACKRLEQVAWSIVCWSSVREQLQCWNVD